MTFIRCCCFCFLHICYNHIFRLAIINMCPEVAQLLFDLEQGSLDILGRSSHYADIVSISQRLGGTQEFLFLDS